MIFIGYFKTGVGERGTPWTLSGSATDFFSDLKSKIEESTFYKDHPERVSKKFVILLPSSCVVSEICGGGEGRGPMIKKEGSLSIESGHGDKARHYNPTVYSIELNGEVKYISVSFLTSYTT